MDLKILHYLFIVNYAYLLFLFIKENFSYYRGYCLQMLFCMGISIAALHYNIENSWLLVATSVLFILLSIIPVLLTKIIMKNHQQHRFSSIKKIARWRYWITRAKIHKQECTLFDFMALVHHQEYAKAISLGESLLLELPKYLHGTIYCGIVISHCQSGNWDKAIEIFNQLPFRQELSLEVLQQMVFAYCKKGYFSAAVSLLLQMENHPQKNLFSEDIIQARICVYAYSGERKKVKALTTDSYWQQIAQTSTYHLPIEIKEQLEFWEKQPDETFSHKQQLEINIAFPWVTLWIVVINLLIFVLMELAGGSQNPLILLNFGGNAFEFVLREQHYWRLASAMFIHSGYLHLILNLFNLFLFGRLVENFYGRQTFFLIYFLSGLTGSLISLWWYSKLQIPMSVGASGAICGLIGANTYFFLFCGRFSPALRNHLISSFLFIIVAMAVMGYLIKYIDNAAHFSGLLAGFLLAALLPPKKTGSVFLKKICSVANVLILSTSLVICASLLKNGKTSYYPYNVSTFNSFKIEANKSESISYFLPFTWRIYPYGADNYYDYYQVSENGIDGNGFPQENLSIQLWPVHSAITKKVIDVLYQNIIVQEKDRLIGHTPVNSVHFGDNDYWHFQIHYREQNDKNFYEDQYFVKINDKLQCRFKFQFPATNHLSYTKIRQEILTLIKINH